MFEYVWKYVVLGNAHYLGGWTKESSKLIKKLKMRTVMLRRPLLKPTIGWNGYFWMLVQIYIVHHRGYRDPWETSYKKDQALNHEDDHDDDKEKDENDGRVSN